VIDAANCENFPSAASRRLSPNCAENRSDRGARELGLGYSYSGAREQPEPRPVSVARAIDLDDLGATLQRELGAARQRLTDLRDRRQRLQREFEAAMAAEEQGRQALAVLRSVAARAGMADEEVPPADADRKRLAGGELRETIARVALRRNAHGRAVHWRTWFDWLHAEGLEAAGKRPEATFLTQLARSPLVRRTEQHGVYVLDVELLQRRREEMLGLQRRLGELPPPDQLALIGDVRSERREVQQRIARAERLLEEAWRTLADELGQDAVGPVQLTELWQQRREDEGS
jgi:hypothetical protein